uniref:Putative ixodes 10 kDa peptide protein n=1 Tax=Ixodes ricinus TaxID=34613 RepID=A0A0K8RHE2_IXORI
MLPISKMQLVVFTMVLILPALQSGGLLSGSEIHDDCDDILTDCGDMKCRLAGSGDFRDYDPRFCTLLCTGPATPKLPNGVCIPGNGLFRCCWPLSWQLRPVEDHRPSNTRGTPDSNLWTTHLWFRFQAHHPHPVATWHIVRLRLAEALGFADEIG